MKKLLVSGCSVTHGTEIFNKFYHPKNIEGSFSQHLANKLGVELKNVAMPGSSNEYIFHSIIQSLDSNTDSVIVLWTSTGRLYWQANARHYFFLGNFASSMSDILEFSTNEKLMHSSNINGCWYTGDSDEVVNHIAEAHKFFVTDYFDHDYENQKLKDYQIALDLICQAKGIQLTQLTWDDVSDIGSWCKENRHPNLHEHQQIAERIYKKYYEKNL